jgi:tripartite-type tricarboxylate transporter receptor subunit TctC
MRLPTHRLLLPLRHLAVVVVFGMLIAACGGGGGAETGEGADAAPTDAAAAEEADAAAATEGGGDTSGGDTAYPERPITYIVAFDPGGGSDVEARRIQQPLEEQLGTSLQIEYRSGGGGAIGWAELASAQPDGYTVGGLVIPHIVIQPLALEDPGYTTEGLRAVAWQVAAPAALLVPTNSRFETIDQFIEEAKANPGQLTVGGVGSFSGSDLALAQLMEQSGIDVTYVPTTGGAGPLISSLAGGHFDAAFLATSHAVRSDEVRALAIAGTERFEDVLPDVPTFSESGYDVTIEYAWGVGMPAGVPDDVATEFGEAVVTAMESGDIPSQVAAEGLQPVSIGPDQAQQYVQEQQAVYEELLPLVEELSAQS